MKKDKIIEYVVVSLFAIGAAIFEKYTNDKALAQSKEELKEELLEELKSNQ